MDELIVRFPSIAEDIFKELDNASLTKCKETCPFWNDTIDKQKEIWIRKIRLGSEQFQEFSNLCNSVIRKTSVQRVKELSLAVQKANVRFCFDRDQVTPHHVVALFGSKELYEYILLESDKSEVEEGEVEPATHDESSSPVPENFYNKKKSFFDTISCEELVVDPPCNTRNSVVPEQDSKIMASPNSNRSITLNNEPDYNIVRLDIGPHCRLHCERMAMEDARIDSFKTPSGNLKSFFKRMDSVKVAKAGFFATLSNNLRCFNCNVLVEGLRRQDDPMYYHARFAPECPFVKLSMGRKYIQACCEGPEEPNVPTAEAEATTASGGPSSGGSGGSGSGASGTGNGPSGTGNGPSGTGNGPSGGGGGGGASTVEDYERLLTCIICMEARVGCTFVPCGHLVTCANCACNCAQCPLCRSPVHGAVKTYFN